MKYLLDTRLGQQLSDSEMEGTLDAIFNTNPHRKRILVRKPVTQVALKSQNLPKNNPVESQRKTTVVKMPEGLTNTKKPVKSLSARIENPPVGQVVVTEPKKIIATLKADPAQEFIDTHKALIDIYYAKMNAINKEFAAALKSKDTKRMLDLQKQRVDLTQTIANNLRDAFSAGIKPGTTKLDLQAGFGKKDKDGLDAGINAFNALTGADLNTTPTKFSDQHRSYSTNDGGIHLHESAFGGINPAVVAHEMGHQLEGRNELVHKKIMDYYQQRVGDNGLHKLRNTTSLPYMPDEVAKDGKFMDPYIGRWYKGNNSELLSMGIQYLYEKPQEVIKQDPSYFKFLYDLLHGVSDEQYR